MHKAADLPPKNNVGTPLPGLPLVVPSRNQRIVRWIGFGVFALILATAAIVGSQVLDDSWQALNRVSGGYWSGLFLVWILWTLMRAFVQKQSLTSTNFTTALLVSEAGEAAKWSPVGKVGGIAVRTQLGTSRGHSARSMLVAFVLAGEALATGLWILVAAAALIDVRRGTADGLDRAGLVGAGVGLSVTSLAAWIIVSDSPVTEWFVRLTLRMQVRVAQRWPRAAEKNLAAAIEQARSEAAQLIRRRALALVAGGIVVYLASGSILWLSLQAVGGGLGWVPLLVVYLPVKAALGFAPTPGGIGFAEAGLGGALVAAGLPVERTIAGVAMYRLFTALFPLLTGTAVGAWWIKRNR